jgi:hypothetical protein
MKALSFEEIETAEIMNLSVNEDVLRRNFMVIVDNFRTIEKRFSLGEERVI